MLRVFISHASDDAAAAAVVQRWLAAANCEAFLDVSPTDGIVAGDEWQQRLHERLRWADAVVCIVTVAYVRSVWCTAEVAVAQSRGCRLLPILLDEAVEHPLLRSVHHIPGRPDLDTVRDAVLQALRRIGPVGRRGWPDGRSPFPGLRPFDTDDRPAFFGREHESAQLAAQVRSPAARVTGALLSVVGPSGCGKSSLVRAGLIPLLAAEDGWWTTRAIRPGADPVRALARELAAAAGAVGLGWSAEQVRRRLAERGLAETADDILLAAPGAPQRLLVVVDQFEEVLTVASPTSRGQFAALLGPALSASVSAVTTLRPEYLDRVLADAELAALPTHVHALRPLRRAALERVIQGPAELAGISVQDGLTQRLVDDTASGEALPLLAFTLAELADGVVRGGELRNHRYEQLGGVRGALSRQADRALDAAREAGGRDRSDVLRELLRLVTVDEHGHPTRRRVLRDELPDIVRDEFDAFVARGLLVTDNDEGRLTVGVAHEAFLSAWSPLAETIGGAASELRAHRAVERAAAEWAESDRPTDLLWERGRLAAHVTAAAGVQAGWDGPRRPASRGSVELSAEAADFLRTSIRRDRRRRWRLTTILSVLLVLMTVATVVAAVQQRSAEQGRQLATARLLLTQADGALAVDPRTAMRLGEAAVQLHPSAEMKAGLVDLMLRSPFSRSLDGETGVVFGIALTDDGTRLAVGYDDGNTTLWDFADRDRPQRMGEPFTAHQGAVYDVAFSPDGRTLATAGADGSVVLWDLADPTRPTVRGNPLPPLPGPAYTALFAPDGHTLLTLGVGGNAGLWDVGDPVSPRPLATIPVGPTDHVVALALAAGGTLLAAATDAGVSLWDIADPGGPRRLTDSLPGSTGLVGAIAFAPDGRTLATGEDGNVRMWDVRVPDSPRPIGEPLLGQLEVINDLAFTPDGRTLATAGADGSAVVWDVADISRPRRVQTFALGSARTVYALVFTPDGRTLVTAGTEGAVLTWELADPKRPRLTTRLAPGQDGVTAIAFDSDRHVLAAAAGDRVTLWDTRDPATVRRLGSVPVVAPERTVDLAFDAGSRTLFVATADGVGLWDVTDVTRPRPLRGITVGGIVGIAGPAGHLLAIGTESGEVQLWDLADPTRPVLVAAPATGLRSLSAIDLATDGRAMALAGGGSVALLVAGGQGTWSRVATALTGDRQNAVEVAFAPDARILATAASDGTGILWDITDPTRPQRLGDPLTGPSNRVGALSFAPDGTTLAAASEDGTAVLWDLSDPAHSRRLGDPLVAQGGGLLDLAFDGDGRRVAAAADDGSVSLWDLGGLDDVREDPLTNACAMTRRGLDRAEWARYLADVPFVAVCATGAGG